LSDVRFFGSNLLRSRWEPGRFACIAAIALLAGTIGTRVASQEDTDAEEAGAPTGATSFWWDPGSDRPLEAYATYPNPSGNLGVLNAAGTIETDGHPFFEPLGPNGRACVSCHQPADAMSLSLASIQERWNETRGADPIFSLRDGADCPNKPRGEASSHRLLLQRGLFRIALQWPPRNQQGEVIEPEFDIEVVRDPGGCNLSDEYGLSSDDPHVSVYRRPRVMANMGYVTHQRFGVGPFVGKTGEPTMRDPETGKPLNMNMMADARMATLKAQMHDAANAHLEFVEDLTDEQIERIETFQNQIYVAQQDMGPGGSLIEPGGPPGLGPYNLRDGEKGVLGNNTTRWVIPMGDVWEDPVPGKTPAEREMRASILRGQKIFHFRTFWIKDSMHLNTVGLGNPTKRTCATCHGMHMMGLDASNGWMDIGTTNLPWAKEAPRNPWETEDELMPLFKITCSRSAAPHPYLGRVIYTQDPGRALISGKCNDVGAIVMQQFRGLAARSPYFSNGSAKTVRELIDFYDRRYNIQYSEQEKTDLGNFLKSL
jgi:hypothetical protein